MSLPLLISPQLLIHVANDLLVEGLGVGGGGRDVGVTGSLVGAGGELELVGGLEVGVAGGAVGGGVILEVEKKGEHLMAGVSRSDSRHQFAQEIKPLHDMV